MFEKVFICDESYKRGAEGYHLQSLLRQKWRREPNIKPYRLFFRLRRKLARVNGKT